jgi:hypothetical protein
MVNFGRSSFIPTVMMMVHVLQYNPPQDAVLTINLPRDIIVLDIKNMRRTVEDHALSL